MSRQYYPPQLTGLHQFGPWAVASEGVGAGYTDECTIPARQLQHVYEDIGTGTMVHNQIFLVQFSCARWAMRRYSQTSYANGAQSLDGSQ